MKISKYLNNDSRHVRKHDINFSTHLIIIKVLFNILFGYSKYWDTHRKKENMQLKQEPRKIILKIVSFFLPETFQSAFSKVL